jgi:hypothetical protein
LQKIVAMGIPPGLPLNLQLQSYIASDRESSKILKSTKPRCHPHRLEQVHDEVATPNVGRDVTRQWLITTIVHDGQRIEPPTKQAT